MPDDRARQPKDHGSLARYLGFRKFVSVTLIKVIHVIGAIGVLAGSVALIVIGVIEGGKEKIALGVVGLTAGSLVWRVLCESLIIAFSIHERLAAVEESQRAFAKYVEWYQTHAGKKL